MFIYGCDLGYVWEVRFEKPRWIRYFATIVTHSRGIRTQIFDIVHHRVSEELARSGCFFGVEMVWFGLVWFFATFLRTENRTIGPVHRFW
jgi:hypothetical protein